MLYNIHTLLKIDHLYYTSRIIINTPLEKIEEIKLLNCEFRSTKQVVA